MSLAVLCVAPPVALAADPKIQIGYPADGQTIGTGPLTVTGSVVASAGARAQVVYAVDVSGSTASPAGLDCNDDGVVSAQFDDFNQDGTIGDTLDCEISAVVALNAALRGVPGSASRIVVGVVGFGDRAAMADLDPGQIDQKFTAPGDTRDGRDVIPRVNAVAGSLTRGTIGLETLRSVGTGTDFQPPLDTAVAAFEPNGPKWVFLLSDGQAPVPDTTALVAAGVKVRTFAVGAAATCAAGSALERIATASGDTCVRVEDPSRLKSDILSTSPSDVRSVTVQLDGGPPKPATVDAIGYFSAAIGPVPAGTHTVVATATLANGSTVPSLVSRFTVRDGIRYVALGDSFSSGEGVEPYIDQQVDKTIIVPRSPPIVLYKQNPAFLCHRSTKAWPMKIKQPGTDRPVANGGSFTFEACSGARLVNVDTQPFEKTYRKVPTSIPLQNKSLGTDVDLVTMTFGGNDVGFVPIVMHCVSQLNCWRDEFVTLRAGTPTAKEVSLDDWTKIRIALIQNELDGLYQQVRSRVRPDTRIIVATYPHLVRVPFRPCTEGLVLAEGERDWLAKRVDDFAKVVIERAGRSNVQVADVRDAFDGHAICDGDNYITGARVARTTDLDGAVASAASFHPNDKGTTAYAEVVSTELGEPAPGAAAGAAAGTRATTDGAAAGARGTAPAPPSAVGAARDAENGAIPGPVQSQVPPAVRGTAPPGGVGRAPVRAPVAPVRDVLDQYPDDVIKAVAETRFSELVIGDGAALERKASCPSDVVPGEYIPYAADNFAPGSTVTGEITWETAAGPTTLTATADKDGRIRGWAQIPAGVPTDRPAAMNIRGTGPGGGTTLGFATVTATADADCRQRVADAGLFNPPSQPPPSGPAGPDPTSGPGGTHAAPAKGKLPLTGGGAWVPIAAATGAALLIVGFLLVVASRRRRST